MSTVEVLCMRALFLRRNNITLIYWGKNVMGTAEVLLTTAVMTAKRITVQFSDGHLFTLLEECV